MKLALNGAMTIGTQDGANIEIAQAVGQENIFNFGMNTDEVSEQWQRGYFARDFYNNDQRLREVIDMIGAGYFSHDDLNRYKPIVDMLLDNDQYMLCADYASYIEAQFEADKLYGNPHAWARSAIINVAKMGHLSSDRAIQEYAEKIWGVESVKS